MSALKVLLLAVSCVETLKAVGKMILYLMQVLCGQNVDTESLLPLYKEFNALIPKRHGASSVNQESPAMPVFRKMAKILGESESKICDFGLLCGGLNRSNLSC